MTEPKGETYSLLNILKEARTFLHVYGKQIVNGQN